jgi:FixJ family two-component response regulator
MPIPTNINPNTAEINPTIYVVDDSADILEAIQVLLNSVNLKARTFASGEEFVSSIDPTARGCLLLDMRMPGMSGLEVQDALKEKCIALPIIFLTGHGEVSTAVQAMRDGALDFIEKPFQPQLLLDRIHACLKVDQESYDEKCKQQLAASQLNHLTPREKEIAKLIVAGKPSKVIATLMDISEKTVDVHRHNIMKKTSIKSTAELVQLWIDAKLETA